MYGGAGDDSVEALPLLGALDPELAPELDGSEEEGTEAVTGEFGVLVEFVEELRTEPEGTELLAETPVLNDTDEEVTEPSSDDGEAVPLLGAFELEPVPELKGRDEDGAEVDAEELDVPDDITDEAGLLPVPVEKLLEAPDDVS